MTLTDHGVVVLHPVRDLHQVVLATARTETANVHHTPLNLDPPMSG